MSDSALDASQEQVLPVLRQAAIEQGEQITGIIWQEAAYGIDGLVPRWPRAGVFIPLSPVFAVSEIRGMDVTGEAVSVSPTVYDFIPSAIELGRPWAEIRPKEGWPDNVRELSVTCTAGWKEDNLPESLRSWLLNRIATLFDMRSDMTGGATSPRDHTAGLLDRWTVKVRPDD